MEKVKKRKIYRPEIEIEYKNVLGALLAVICILKFGIRRAEFNFTIGNRIMGKQRAYIIPKYTFKKAANK